MRYLSPQEEQSREPGDIAGETMDSVRAMGCFAVKWVLPFITSALLLTSHCNVLNGGISQGSHVLPQKCVPGFTEALFELIMTALVNGALVVTCGSTNALFNSPPSASCIFFQIQMWIFLPCPPQRRKAVFATVFVLLFAFDMTWSLTVHQPFTRACPGSFFSPFSSPEDTSWL